ncbi:MAG: hypothetical protein MI725_02535, partial [Pirellulales bacterium]|nr:hypothetical protein [Pirellulales bacterium]
MDDAASDAQEQSEFPVARVQPVQPPGKTVGILVSRLWLATLLCLMVALVLVLLDMRAGGPAIDVHLSQGHGLQPGDPVRF